MNVFVTIIRRQDKSMKKKKVKGNGNGAMNGVTSTVTDIVLSSFESENELTMRFGLQKTVYCAITAMMMRVCMSTKLFQSK
jgi:hypothetical protein